jgi:hypothetical protein
VKTSKATGNSLLRLISLMSSFKNTVESGAFAAIVPERDRRTGRAQSARYRQ